MVKNPIMSDLHQFSNIIAYHDRHWMKTVLQPLNEKAAKIITEHADLLEGASVEPLLLKLVAHVSAYRVILERQVMLSSTSQQELKPQCLMVFNERICHVPHALPSCHCCALLR